LFNDSGMCCCAAVKYTCLQFTLARNLHFYMVLRQSRLDKVYSAFSYSCHNALVLDRSLSQPSISFWYTSPDASFLHPEQMTTEHLETEKCLIQDVKQDFVKVNFSAHFDGCVKRNGEPRDITGTHQICHVKCCESLHFHAFIRLLLVACIILKI
jgi:hypothetical protein